MAGLAETEIEQSAGAVWMRRLLGLAVALAAVGGLATIVSGLGKGNSGPARQVARISIVPDTPPPPPPPREERKIEPPKVEQKQIQVEQPKPDEAPPQPAETLKMEGAGSETGIAGVQAGTVTEDYRGQTIGGENSGGGGAYHWYGSVVQRELQQLLLKSAKLRGADYRINVRLWVAPDGDISRVELAGTTGNKETDELLRSVLAELPALRDRPPADMPQPIRLRVTSRT